MKHFAIILGMFCFVTIRCWAGEQVGRLTQIEGIVKIHTHPSKVQTAKQDARFEGMFYKVADGKAGDSVENGNIIRTTPGSKARVVFPNGDQYYVGPATSYQVSFEKDAGQDSRPVLLLPYGKIRGVVEKGGPRSKLIIRSKGVTMGVRGTDFFISSTQPGVEITTLRGEVKVEADTTGSDKKDTKLEPVFVKTGQSVDYVAPITPKKSDEVSANSALETTPPADSPKTETP
ncbi:MAG: FecR family protein, partial [Bdellovibrionota bacterium]